MEELGNLGPVGLLFVYVIKTYFDAQKAKAALPDPSLPILQKIEKQLESLVEMHNVKNDEGQFVWYANKTGEKQGEKNADALLQMRSEIKDIRKLLAERGKGKQDGPE